MAKRLLILVSLLSCASLGTAVDASAAKKRAVKKPVTPTVRSIVPMKAQVGEKLTINGSNFASGNGKTKVYFLREGGGVAWVPSDSGSKTRLVVTVPEKLIPLMRGTAEARKATRFQIRLLTKRFGTATKLAKSPLLTAPNATPGGGETPAPGGPATPPDGDCDGDGTKNSVDLDDDNDALTDDLETYPAHTDPCKADTDGDTIADGFEYHSARDLNVSALPYPSKKPWPNPLDSKDAEIDHDGDGLDLIDEFLLWKYYGNLSVPLNYSAGLQRSVDENAPTDVHSAYRDVDGNGKLSDDERDGDGDGLNNWDEAHGRMLQKWWDTMYNGQNGGYPKETPYPNTFPGVSIFDPDSDGDGVIDGDDDQDHDGLSNRFEIERPANWFDTYIWYGSFPFPGAGSPGFDDGANPWSRVQPYNPCKPVRSHTCHLYVPPGYYEDGEIWGGVKRENAGPAPVSPWTYLPNGGDELPQYPG
ncbi:MAG TPA: IPT/TIG domain-containing protein [Thermoleophilaceae bacterium]